MVWFIIYSFVLSWGLALWYYLSGGRIQSPGFIVIALFYMAAPAIAAILVQKFTLHKPVKKPMGINFKMNWWWLIAWIMPVILSIATLGVTLLLPGITFSPGMEGIFKRFGQSLTPAQVIQMKKSFAAMPVHPFFITIVQSLVAGVTINAVAALGEELGWRGFMVEHLKKNFWKMCLIIGLVWGVWHAPLIIQGYNYPQHPLVGALFMTIFCILFTPFLVIVRLKSGSVIPAAIAHGTFNAAYGLSILLISGGNDLTTGMLGLPGFFVLLIMNIIILFTYSHKQAK